MEDFSDICAIGTRPSTAIVVKHVIELNQDKIKPIHSAPGRTAPAHREIIRQQIEDMLNNGVIKESRSPWSSRVVLVKKKDGKLRFCVDYRGLNKVTKKNVYPLPRIDDALAALQTGKFFSTLDLFAGYWLIPMDEDSKQYTAFVCERGLFQFEVMPFGLCNAGATFQRFMYAVLGGLKWKSLLVYLDDIIVFSATIEDHIRDLTEVFTRLRNAKLQLNLNKCKFLQEKFNYLGHIVSQEGIEPDPNKVNAIVNIKSPTNTSELRSILGSCSYFRNFMPNFASVSKPLYELASQENKWLWTEKEEEIWLKIKKLLTSAPILKHPDFRYPFIVQTDASSSGLGGVLLQRIDEEERIIQYISRSLHVDEKKWAPREQEVLAIVWACETFAPFLIGKKFIIESDHLSLKWLMEAKTPRLVRWALRLSEFEFEIHYRKGKTNGNADMLSRDIEYNNRSKTDERIVNYNLELDQDTTLQDIHINNYLSSVNLDIYRLNISPNDIRIAQQDDQVLVNLINQCKNEQTNGFCIKQNLLFKCNKDGKMLLMIPNSLKTKILELYHDHELGGHVAVGRLIKILSNRFYWLRMYQDIKEYVRSCMVCQKIKTKQPISSGLLKPIKTIRPFQLVGVDIVILRPTMNKNKYILVTIDYFTNWVEAVPMKNQSAEECVKAFFSSVISRHGCPEEVMSDSGTQFSSGVLDRKSVV